MYNWHCNSKVLDILTIYVQKFLLTGGWGMGEGGDLVFKDRSKIEVNCTIVCISGDYMIKANLVN